MDTPMLIWAMDPEFARRVFRVLEVSWIFQMKQDEKWYAGERRHCPVEDTDQEVQEHMIDAVMREGALIRRMLREELAEGVESDAK